MAGILQDLRYALRQLHKRLGFTAVAVLSLAVGIGAGTAVFSVANAILLRSLPVPNPQELRELQWAGDAARVPSLAGNGSVSPPVYERLREAGSSRAEVFGFVPLDEVIVRSSKEAFIGKGAMVSDNFFSGLGVPLLMGRALMPGQDYADAGSSAVISHDLWEKHFGSDPNIVGKVLGLNRTDYTVVGVLPRGFTGVQSGQPSDFYVPMSANSQFLYVPITSRFHWYVRMMARLKPGVSDAQLATVLDVVLARETADMITKPRMLLKPGFAGIAYDRDNYREPLLIMLAVVGLVLLAACANVAGLSLVGGARRNHEFAVRSALGANRFHLARQSFFESLILALAGGALGVLLAFWGRNVIALFLPGSTNQPHYDLSIDGKVLAFALVTSFVTALLFGVLPALRTARVDPIGGLKSRTAIGAPQLKIGKLLVSAQICLSLLLLTAAGLCLRTVVNLTRIDAGFNVEKLLLFQLNLRGSDYANSHPDEFYARVQAALNFAPGVRTASFIEFPLLNDGGSEGGFSTFSGRATSQPTNMQTRRITVGETFFAAMGVPIIYGRSFDAADNESAPKAIVVNETFVRKYLPNENPLGLTIRMWEADWQIVGVCRDMKYAILKDAVPPTTYFPFRQRFYSRFRQTHLRGAYFAVRSALPAQSLVPEIRKIVHDIDATVPVANISTQEAIRDRGISQERFFAALCGGLALLAILLSCIGLYSLMAYNVVRRTGEIGVRMALGATPSTVARSILRDATLLASIGLALGVPASVALARLFRNRLYGVAPADPITLISAVVLLIAVGILAAYIPARRASKVDPMVALRYE